jgi:hypothetical protein
VEIQFGKFSYPEELNEQRRLFIECFPENSGTAVETIKHYEWKFKSFPSDINAYEYVAKTDDEIIGYYASIPYEYIINGKPVITAMVCDVMTGIKARGNGVFTKLGVYSTDQFKAEGLAFSTGYPIRPEVIPGHKKAGWEFPFQIPMYGKFLKMNSFLKTRNKTILIPAANLALSLYNKLLSFVTIRSKHLIFETYQSDQLNEITGLDEFYLQWKKENPVTLNKNIQFLKWRLGAPEKKYHLIVQRDISKKKIAGYAILRNVVKEGVPCMGVLDFCVLDNYLKWAKSLVLQIDKISKSEKAELILMMMTKSKAKKYNIKKCGFVKTPFPFSFIIKQFDDSIDSSLLRDEQNWSLMWIDSDDL